MQVNDEKLLCVIEHVTPQIVTNVDVASNPAPFIVKLRPPDVPPCTFDNDTSVRSYVNKTFAFE